MRAFFSGGYDDASSDSSEEPPQVQHQLPLRTPVAIDLNNDGKVDVVLTPDELRSLVLERHMAMQAPVVPAQPAVPPVLVQPPTMVYQAPRVPPAKTPRGRWVWVPRSKLLEQAALRKMSQPPLQPPQAEAGIQVPTPPPVSSSSLQRTTQSQLMQAQLPSTQSAVPPKSSSQNLTAQAIPPEYHYQETFQSVKVSPGFTPRGEVPYHNPYKELGCAFSSAMT
ncbi:unnamed protein product [Durusdinium trenchii]|uniref:Uncharacterized protein n=1 Tax=Durusdinium trenchii TaxID=1381693 RepID=A0ABP0J6X7_9DINO